MPGGFNADGQIRPVYVQVQRISQRRYLQELYFISRQAPHFEKLERNGFDIEICDRGAFANFELVDGSSQRLFRLNKRSKSKVFL